MSLVHDHLTSGALSGSRQQHIRVPVGTYYLARGQNYTTYARTANDFEDAWTALVNEYGLQEENAYLHKAQMLIDDEMKPNDSQEIDTNRKDVKRALEATKLLISHPSEEK
ncbi:hypothetical protein OsI_04621 [Oryza sativa Indica Group]|uniref:Uncharacterized protein n=1 Tax=Oryza sativa subsp. indica TaxID=39946 RepID=A2WXG9_ORYSI|nr:hypothetical protein OsI_04621 [Oryza sativa Indica Group]